MIAGVAAFYLSAHAAEAPSPSSAVPPPAATPNITAEFQKLNPGQRGAIEKELSKTGGALTPEAIETLRKKPEFKGLKPEEIIKGRELLNKDKEEPTGKAQVKKEAKEGREDGWQSLFDRYFASDPDANLTARLKPFGYELFTDSALTPPQDLPVASDYMIGPGDEINVLLWGRINEQYLLTVSRDGSIQFPNIGPLSVAGMTFDEMKRYISGQAKKIIGAEINLTMGRLRSIQVFVLGEVKKPGAYSVSAMATLTNALMASGGPTFIGSLRRVELKRTSKTPAVMDFYDLLLKGNKSKDLRLQNGDVLFVPTVGPLVGIAGNVRRPAVYELKDSTTLSDAFELAGGIIPTAYTQRIQVERVEKNEHRIVVDVNAKDSDALKNFILLDADLVKVTSIVDNDVNAVYLYGNVKRPGKYELKGNMRLKDILKDETTLLPETHLEYGLIKRPTPPVYETRLIPFNLGRLLFEGSEADNIELKPRDSVYIFSKWFFKEKPAVVIEGEVRTAGQYPFEQDLTIKDLVLQAGGLTNNAYHEEFELYRTDPSTKDATLKRFMLSKAMDGDGAHNIKLQDMDRVVVHSVWEFTPRPSLSISGEVSKKGQFPYAANMTVKDLIFAAGGLLESAYLGEAELTSSSAKDGKAFSIESQLIDIKKAMAGDPEQNMLLKPYDNIFIKRIPEWRETEYVELNGEVQFPGKYVIKKGERLSSILKRAGGFTANAYPEGAAFTRKSLKELQQKSLADIVSRLEQELLSRSIEAVETALTPEAAQQEKTAIEQKNALIKKLKEATAKGRLYIKLPGMEGLERSPYDIELENGDALTIPARPGSVTVLGAVFNPNSFVFAPKGDVSDYIELAGGLTRNADEDSVYVLKADGSASSAQQEGWGFMSSKVNPGDTVVVPEQYDRTAWLREAKDITQILYQIAVTAGVIIVAF